MSIRTGKLTALLGIAVLSLGLMTVGVSSAAAKSSPPADQTKYEAWLNQQVHHELVTLPWYGVFDNLEYKIDGSQVTLMGQVIRPVTKSDAENVVKKIEGVTRVVNEIKVLPPSPFDDGIRRAEYRAIFSEPSLSKYSLGAIPSIHMIVENGHVTLEGVVANEADRNLANIRANTVPNVFSVTNNLRIG